MGGAVTDLHALLDALRPLGWSKSHAQPGLYLEPSHGGPMWIRPDGPGRVVVSRTSVTMRGEGPLKAMRLDEVERYIRKLTADRARAASRLVTP